MNPALLAADIVSRFAEMKFENRENQFNLVFNLIKNEQQRCPVKSSQTLSTEQMFELKCLQDWLTKVHQTEHDAALRRITNQGGGATSEHERNLAHWLKTIEEILK